MNGVIKYLKVKFSFVKSATVFLAINLILINSAFSARQIQEVNYFSSLRASETNVRSGPGQNYPVKYTYKVKGIPVRVISEYDNWNEIEDYEGKTGWVTQSLITKKRTLMVYSKKPTVEMRKKNKIDSHLVFRLENFVIGDYLKCEEEWCAIKINGKKGWVEKNDVFGVDSKKPQLVDQQQSPQNQEQIKTTQNPSLSSTSNLTNEEKKDESNKNLLPVANKVSSPKTAIIDKAPKK